jgi:predicted PurR-regulated permease PerM
MPEAPVEPAPEALTTLAAAGEVYTAETDDEDEQQPRRGPAPFMVGFAAAVGVGLAYLLFLVVTDASGMLVLVALSLFFAVGMDPLVRTVHAMGPSRPLAVGIVFLGLAAVATAFGFAVVAPLTDQITSFAHHLPTYLDDLKKNPRIHRLDSRFHLLDKANSYVQSGDLTKTLAGRLLSAGTAVASTLFDGLTVLILTLYFMAYLDEITKFAHRLVPRSRREGAEEVSAKITQQLGEYVAGNLVMALIAGVVAVTWLAIIGAPYPIALAFVIALLDVIPLVGAAVAAIIVSTILLIDSTPLGIATIAFFIVYQIVENYVLVPRLFRTRVTINPAATIIGALVGATLLGVVGFLLAIPLVATLDLVLRDVVIPRQRRR